MKLFIISAIVLLSSLVTKAQDIKPPQKDPKNIISISGGVWERDYSIATGAYLHSFGPMFALEYQRLFNDYVSFRGEFFGGGIYYNNEYSDMVRTVGVSAGILVTPFGKKFRYLKLGVSPMVFNHTTMYHDSWDNENVASESYMFGIEFPIRFNFVDNKKWMLGIGFDIQTCFWQNTYALFTTQCMVHFGYKF